VIEEDELGEEEVEARDTFTSSELGKPFRIQPFFIPVK
jgi:hypothetical protein